MLATRTRRTPPRSRGRAARAGWPSGRPPRSAPGTGAPRPRAAGRPSGRRTNSDREAATTVSTRRRRTGRRTAAGRSVSERNCSVSSMWPTRITAARTSDMPIQTVRRRGVAVHERGRRRHARPARSRASARASPTARAGPIACALSARRRARSAARGRSRRRRPAPRPRRPCGRRRARGAPHRCPAEASSRAPRRQAQRLLQRPERPERPRHAAEEPDPVAQHGDRDGLALVSQPLAEQAHADGRAPPAQQASRAAPTSTLQSNPPRPEPCEAAARARRRRAAAAARGRARTAARPRRGSPRSGRAAAPSARPARGPS